MTTKVINIKHFRQNMTQIWQDAKNNKVRYVVMYHAKPVFELNPINAEEFILENLAKDVAEAREDLKKGKVHSEEDVYAALGL